MRTKKIDYDKADMVKENVYSTDKNMQWNERFVIFNEELEGE